MINFFSVGADPLILEFKEGLHLITGTNKDNPTEKNGIGKCLDPNTEVDIQIQDETVLEMFRYFCNENSKYLCNE